MRNKKAEFQMTGSLIDMENKMTTYMKQSFVCIILLLAFSCEPREPRDQMDYKTFTGRVVNKTMRQSWFYGDQCLLLIQTKDGPIILETYTPSYIGEYVFMSVEKGDSVLISNVRRRNFFGKDDITILK